MKTPLELAQSAFTEWLTLLADLLHEAEISFEEFQGSTRIHDTANCGVALARAERAVKQAKAEIAAGLKAGV